MIHNPGSLSTKSTCLRWHVIAKLITTADTHFYNSACPCLTVINDVNWEDVEQVKLISSSGITASSSPLSSFYWYMGDSSFPLTIYSSYLQTPYIHNYTCIDRESDLWMYECAPVSISNPTIRCTVVAEHRYGSILGTGQISSSKTHSDITFTISANNYIYIIATY